MKTKLLIRKLHKYVGLFAALWVLFLAVTGFLLQNDKFFKLESTFISNSLILKSYNLGEQYIAFGDQNNHLTQIDKQISINDQFAKKLDKEITSAIYFQDNWIVSTTTQIIWFSPNAEEVQSLDELDGLEVPIQKIGILNNEILYQTGNQLFDLNGSEMVVTNQTKMIEPKIYGDTEFKKSKLQKQNAQIITLKKFILDLHSGLLSSTLLNNLAAISLIWLSISGLVIFINSKPRNKNKK